MRTLHRVLRQLILGEKVTLKDHRSTGNLRQNPDRWVVTYEVGGNAVKYFRWDRDEVWKWTKTPSMASSFMSEEAAHREMQNCEAGWRYQYSIKKLSV